MGQLPSIPVERKKISIMYTESTALITLFFDFSHLYGQFIYLVGTTLTYWFEEKV